MKQYLQKYHDLILYVAFFIILFYPFNISFKEYIFDGQLSILSIYVIGILLLVLANYENIIYTIKNNIKLLVISSFLIIVIIIFRNADIINGHYGMPFFTTLIFLLIIILKDSKNWQKIVLNVVMFYVFEHVVGTLFCSIFREFYLRKIFPLFPNFANELLYQYEHKQIAGITHHYSTNAAYLLIGIIIQTFSPKLKKDNYTHIALYVLNIIALLLTGKRTQVIFGAISIIIVMLITKKMNINSIIKKIKINYIIVGITCISLILIVFPTLLSPITRTIDGIRDNDLFASREPLYELAINKFKDSKLIGNGWGSYKYLYHDNVINKEREYMDTHNIYLQMLCEIGIIGLSIFIIIISLIVYKAVKAKNINMYLSIFLTFQIYILFEGLVGNAFYDIPIILPYAIFLSMFVENTKILN